MSAGKPALVETKQNTAVQTNLELLDLRLVEHGEDIGRVAVRPLLRLLRASPNRRHFVLLLDSLTAQI